jgi:hypothetical protein
VTVLFASNIRQPAIQDNLDLYNRPLVFMRSDVMRSAHELESTELPHINRKRSSNAYERISDSVKSAVRRRHQEVRRRQIARNCLEEVTEKRCYFDEARPYDVLNECAVRQTYVLDDNVLERRQYGLRMSTPGQRYNQLERTEHFSAKLPDH